ncbi:small metal-binding protein SmbP [Nitrosomonas sp. Nm33]|uniref:small metal-binding protein SmbP n=2 Tax=unclassified Nitrosomonas TaxID=2609265 RepID=UPI0008969340|nr:small metal-binding protein SmbP [Nitrosomonas sp. Nm33]SDZ12776.1 Small metal-binding protein [Nitrosomonas sp. Nm33]
MKYSNSISINLSVNNPEISYTQVYASAVSHASEAMEHAGKAQAHGESGHSKEAL